MIIPANTLRPLGLLALCLGVGCARSASVTPPVPQVPTTAEAAPPPAAPVPPDLPHREDLPMEARMALTARMASHGEAMTLLLGSVVCLEHDDAEFLATQIAEEPKIDRPDAGDTDSFNALLPRSFFDYQDALYASVAQVATAARRHQDMELAKAFGALTGTCVACHSAYLHDELDGKPGDLAAGPALSSGW